MKNKSTLDISDTSSTLNNKIKQKAIRKKVKKKGGRCSPPVLSSSSETSQQDMCLPHDL